MPEKQDETVPVPDMWQLAFNKAKGID